jgi:hypothetical protein
MLAEIKTINMKNSVLYSIAISLLLFASCYPENESPSISGELPCIGKEEAQFIFQDHGIDSIVGENELKAYKEFLDSVIIDLKAFDSAKYANVEDQLIYGAKVQFGELVDILSSCDTPRSLFVMTGLKVDEEGVKGPADIIFGVRHGEADLRGEGDDIRMEYFDFTNPCPSACPPIDLYEAIRLEGAIDRIPN